MRSSEFLKDLESPKEADLQHRLSSIRSKSTNIQRNVRCLLVSNIATLNMVNMLLILKPNKIASKLIIRRKLNNLSIRNSPSISRIGL